MTEEIKEILNCIDNNVENYYVGTNGCLYQDLTKEQLLLIKNHITNLQKENEKLKELCDKYEEEHSKAFKLWKANMEKIPPFDKFLDYKQELDQCKNNWEELKKWLDEKQDLTCGCGITPEYKYAYENTLDKMKELEEDK